MNHKHSGKHKDSKTSQRDGRHASGDEIRQFIGIVALVVIALGVGALILFPSLRPGYVKKSDASSGSRQKVFVLAAASLNGVLSEAVSSYASVDSTTDIQLSCASSNLLRHQIERGAPVDLYLSAAPEHVDALVDHGWVKPENRYKLWTTELALVAPPGFTAHEGLKDLLLDAARIAIGDVGVPVGDYARQSLANMGLQEDLKDRLIPMADEPAVRAAVASGACDLGFAYLAAAHAGNADKQVTIIGTISERTHAPILYVGAILNDAEHPEKARRFLEFLRNGKGREIMENAGFEATAEMH
ncbi:MAG TPA: molybdate ABC transporter substrate-binding protein [Candidatus Krumholzibacteria bacterium]|nr:molybdate ABC transporter substrate-binding protein [Candidatus Krumholzibacteria bacterium]